MNGFKNIIQYDYGGIFYGFFYYLKSWEFHTHNNINATHQRNKTNILIIVSKYLVDSIFFKSTSPFIGMNSNFSQCNKFTVQKVENEMQI